MLTLPEAAEALAVSMTVAYNLVQSGELVAMQLGPKKIWRVKPEELDAYIERAHAATQAALRAKAKS